MTKVVHRASPPRLLDELETRLEKLERRSVGTTLVSGVQSIAYAATVVPDARGGDLVLVGLLTGNITVNAPTNPVQGGQLLFHFQQDSTGGWTITFAANYKVSWSPSTTADARNTITVRCVDAAANVWVQWPGVGLPA